MRVSVEPLGLQQAGEACAPLVTVVVPAFNRKDDLLPALESVLAQDMSDMEIIIVDDGSTDGTSDVDFAAKDPRIRVVRHLVNRGGGAARNTGIGAARGQFIALLDSDDRWRPGKLRAQLKALTEAGCIEQYGNGHRVLCDFICAANVLTEWDSGQSVHNDLHPDEVDRLDHYLMIEGQALQTSTMLLPVDLARKIRFRDGLRRHQDWDFALRLVQAGARLVYLPEPQAVYCLTDDPARVSRQKGRLRATLDWYRTSGARLDGDAMRTYFIRSVLSRDLGREPFTALFGLWWLATRAPGDAARLMSQLRTEAIAKWGGRRRPRE